MCVPETLLLRHFTGTNGCNFLRLLSQRNTLCSTFAIYFTAFFSLVNFSAQNLLRTFIATGKFMSLIRTIAVRDSFGCS